MENSSLIVSQERKYKSLSECNNVYINENNSEDGELAQKISRLSNSNNPKAQSNQSFSVEVESSNIENNQAEKFRPDVNSRNDNMSDEN